MLAGEGPGPMARLQASLDWAVQTVPAYQQYRSLMRGGRDPREVLAELPITDKLDIKRNPDKYMSRAMPPWRCGTSLRAHAPALSTSFFAS